MNSVLSAVQHLLGGGNHVVVMNGGGKVVQHAPMTPQQQQQANAQIEADAAKMWNQAHPGQMYTENQNGEFKPGELPATPAWHAPMAPLPYRAVPQPQPQFQPIAPVALKPMMQAVNRPQAVMFAGHLLNNFAPSGAVQGQPLNVNQMPSSRATIRIR